MDPFCYLSFVTVILSCQLNAALWSPTKKGLPSWFSICHVFLCFDTSPCGVLGQVWCLIVSIPDLCLLHYLVREGQTDDYFSFFFYQIIGER